MKKSIIILSAIALFACNGRTSQKNKGNAAENNAIVELQNDQTVPFDYLTLPAEWAELSYTGENEKYVICAGNENALTIKGNKFVYWDNRYDILKSHQIGDTIAFHVKLSKSSGEYEFNFKFFWLDKNKGIAQWTINDRNLGDSGLFVIKEKLSEFPIQECWGEEGE